MEIKSDENLISSRDLFTAKAAALAARALSIAGSVAIGATFIARGRQMLPSALRTEGPGQTVLALATGAALLAAGPLERVVKVAETARSDAAINAAELRAGRNAAELKKALDLKAAGTSQGIG